MNSISLVYSHAAGRSELGMNVSWKAESGRNERMPARAADGGATIERDRSLAGAASRLRECTNRRHARTHHHTRSSATRSLLRTAAVRHKP